MKRDLGPPHTSASCLLTSYPVHSSPQDEPPRRLPQRSPSPVPAASGRAPPPRRRSPSPPPPPPPVAVVAPPAGALASRLKVPEYGVRVPQQCVTTLERDYLELLRRHSHLAVPSDFTRLLCSWVRAQPSAPDSLGVSLLPLDRHIRYDHELDLTRVGGGSTVAAGHYDVAGRSAYTGVKYFAKVRLRFTDDKFISIFFPLATSH